MAEIGFGVGLGIAARAGMGLDPHLACHFLVEIDSLIAGNFSECTGLAAETEVLEYRAGGENEFIHRLVGPTKHPPLVLKRGMSPIDGLWEWHQDVVAGKIRRRNGTVYLLNQHKLPVMWWNFSDALPVKWTGPTLLAGSAAIAFETVELVHRGLGRPRFANPDTGVAGETSPGVLGSGGFF
jgi:phage tail-like protein